LKNKLTRRFEKMEKEGVAPDELVKIGEGALRRAVLEGDVEEGSVMIGQIAGLVGKLQPAAEILKEMAEECEKLLRDSSRFLIEGSQSQ
jgi:enoyl-[acyl-carrier protein] reductase II